MGPLFTPNKYLGIWYDPPSAFQVFVRLLICPSLGSLQPSSRLSAPSSFLFALPLLFCVPALTASRNFKMRFRLSRPNAMRSRMLSAMGQTILGKRERSLLIPAVVPWLKDDDSGPQWPKETRATRQQNRQENTWRRL